MSYPCIHRWPLSLLLAAALGLSACASTAGTSRRAGSERLYAADIHATVSAAETSLIEAGLGIDEQGWIEPERRYSVMGREQTRVLTGGEGSVQVGWVRLHLEALTDSTTQVTLTTSQDRTHAMASTADRTDYERLVFTILDAKLPAAEPTP